MRKEREKEAKTDGVNHFNDCLHVQSEGERENPESEA